MAYIGDGYLYIYSNDGSTQLGYFVHTISESGNNGIVTDSGATVNYGGNTDTYSYAGNLKFVGFATEPNATEPTYAIDDTFAWASDTTANYGEDVTNLYIVESLEGTTWYVPSGWEVAARYGNFNVDLTEITSNNVTTKINSTINFGASIDDDLNYVATSNSIGFWNTDGTFTLINNTQSITFKFGDTGGGLTSPDLISWLTTYGTQLKVTDLTNTTWTVNAGWEAEAGYGAFDLSGSFNDIDGMVFLGIGNSKETFTTTTAVADRITWSNGGKFQTDLTPADSFSVNITGGTDVTNPKLIAWLSKWGELQVEEEGETPPDDLTGYTVTVPANWTASSGYGMFGFDADLTANGHSYGTIEVLNIGYSFDWVESEVITQVNNIFVQYTGLDLRPVDTFTLSNIGTTNSSNPSLIQWFADNKAIFTKEGEEETPETPETTTPHGEIYYKGNLVATLVEGETIVLHTKDFKFLGDIVIKNVGEVEEEETNTVNITLSGAIDTSASASFTGVSIKFGSPPTSNTDYDYTTIQGSNLYDREHNYITTPTSVSVSPIAYIWQDYVDTNAGYILNGGSLITTNNSYTAPTEINLNEGDTLTLVCTQD